MGVGFCFWDGFAVFNVEFLTPGVGDYLTAVFCWMNVMMSKMYMSH